MAANSDNIVHLNIRRQDEDKMDALQRYHDMYLSGEVTSFVLVAQHKDGDIYAASDFPDRLALLGAVEHAKQKVSYWMSEED